MENLNRYVEKFGVTEFLVEALYEGLGPDGIETREDPHLAGREFLWKRHLQATELVRCILDKEWHTLGEILGKQAAAYLERVLEDQK